MLLFTQLTRIALLAVLLLAPASLDAAYPWVDHSDRGPIGVPGAIFSGGLFRLPPNYEFVRLQIWVINKKTRLAEEHLVPFLRIQRERDIGHWNIRLPYDPAEYEVSGILTAKDVTDGKIIKMTTGFSDVSVPAPLKK
jgi:hypothetical protein